MSAGSWYAGSWYALLAQAGGFLANCGSISLCVWPLKCAIAYALL